MNENIDLAKILKDCPKGWKFYTPLWGEVTFNGIKREYCGICIDTICGCQIITIEGYYTYTSGAECIIFPSKDQRDWSKFVAPWYKKDKFDPKTFQPFDKVLIKRGTESYYVWFPDLISLPPNDFDETILCLTTDDVVMAIPYNEDTKHLIGTSEEAPEFYRYWED